MNTKFEVCQLPNLLALGEFASALLAAREQPPVRAPAPPPVPTNPFSPPGTVPEPAPGPNPFAAPGTIPQPSSSTMGGLSFLGKVTNVIGAFFAMEGTLQAPTPNLNRSRDRDPSGVAFIHYYAPGVVGRFAHYAITVHNTSNDSIVDGGSSSQLVGGGRGNPSTWVVNYLPTKPTSVPDKSIPLPNAQAAMTAQVAGPRGPYVFSTNSCITHVGDVLRAGGVSNVGVTATQIQGFFRTVGVPTEWRPRGGGRQF